MPKKLVITLLSLSALAWARPALAQSIPDPVPAAVSVHRFVLIVGANDGGPDRERLRYAGTDANALSAVMRELGGVQTRDRAVLLDPTPAQLRASFDLMQAKVTDAKRRGERVQFMFYYSGHSDERGLLLRGVLLPYRELRGMIESIPSDVQLGVLDSCASGSFTRIKGGRRASPFLSSGPLVEGHAYLTSSSADEAAQESDRVKGSFFTHFLITGLRGGADTNHDKMVTLNEAYRFAFDETLARTELASGGAQHAAYDIRLTGSGDLVMTDLRETTAQLEVAKDIGGRLYVRDSYGKLAAELYKPAGSAAVTLALEPGNYRVTLDDGQRLLQADAVVREGRPIALARAQFRPLTPEATTARGEPQTPEPTAPVSIDASAYRHIPFDLALVGPASLNAMEKEKKVINSFSLGIIYSQNARTQGVALSLGAAISTEAVKGVQASLAANVSGEVHGVQTSVGTNIATGTLEGVQATTGVNVANSTLKGVQAAAGVNIVRGSMRGVQAAAGVNVAVADMRGAQFTSGVNVANDITGAQVGIINISRGRVRGAQVGIINYADETDASIALLPITRKGGVAGEAWTSDTALVNVGLRLRAKYTYGFLAIGVHPFGNGQGLMGGLGLGGRVPIAERLFLDIDAAAYSVFQRFDFVDSAMLNQVRLTFGVRFGKRFEVWGGPTLNVYHRWDEIERTRIGYGWSTYRYVNDDDTYALELWPGFVAGVRF